MRANATRIESIGSWWFLDEDNHEYLRMPKTEGPRKSPPGADWGGPSAGALQDLLWHPYKDWRIDPLRDRLVIERYDGLFVFSPLPWDSSLGSIGRTASRPS